MNDPRPSSDPDYVAVLERITVGAPLAELLLSIIQLVERRSPQARCAIELRESSATSVAPGFEGGASPIHGPNGEVLGAVRLHIVGDRAPTADEIAATGAAAYLTGLALTRDRHMRALQTSELRAKQLARLFGLSSSVSGSILRTQDPTTLYELACRLAVEHGLARLAWVGLLGHDGDLLEPVARAGIDDGYVDTVRLRLGDSQMNRGPAVRAITTGAPAVSNDIANDATFYFKNDAVSRGLLSCAAFPMKHAGRTLGAFVLYADQAGYFCDEELRVLGSLADHIAFAVDAAQVARDEALHALIYKVVGDVIFYIAVEGPGAYRFLSVNPAFLSATGLAEAQVVGRPIDDVIPEPSRSIVRAHYAEAIRTRATVTWEEITPYPTGLRHGEISVTPRFDDQGRCTHLVGTVHDVTARKRAEDERRQLEAQLHQSQRIQSLGTLAGGIAHDFNNILAAIGGNTDLLLEEIPADQPTHEYADEIRKAVNRASGLVRQILAFSRHESPRRQTVEMRPLVEEAARLLRASLPASIELVLRWDAAAPKVSVDATQLHQIVMNLCTNAAHALPQRRGRIEVSVLAVTLEPGRPLPSPDLAPGRYTVLRVRDTGCGMDRETLARIFDPFFTTKPAGEGTGLGLSVVHGIVKNHGGVITVESVAGGGTSFDVYFLAAS